MNGQLAKCESKGPSHLRRLLMNVADQGLEFSQAIWFMLERNAVKCHVVLICRLLLLRQPMEKVSTKVNFKNQLV